MWGHRGKSNVIVLGAWINLSGASMSSHTLSRMLARSTIRWTSTSDADERSAVPLASFLRENYLLLETSRGGLCIFTTACSQATLRGPEVS